jgi:hypothetical protein
MARLDVVGQATRGAAKAFSTGGAVAQVAVTRDSDGSPITGLTDAEFQVWVSFAENVTAGVQATGFMAIEKAPAGRGPDGVYTLVFFNGPPESSWGPDGIWFVDVVANVAGDQGQTVLAFTL